MYSLKLALIFIIARVPRFELGPTVLETGILPLYYTRVKNSIKYKSIEY